MRNQMLETTGEEEVLAYHKYHQMTEKDSSIIPGLVVGDLGEGMMTCPRCGTEQPGIPHDATRACPKCSLNMKRQGNALILLK